MLTGDCGESVWRVIERLGMASHDCHASGAAVVIMAASEAYRPWAVDLAAQTGLPVVCSVPAPTSLALRVGSHGVELLDPSGRTGHPVQVDFAAVATALGGVRTHPVARAVGLRSGSRPDVVDATAGLGRDAFLLATLGCRVTMIERSVVMHAMLIDGMRRACQEPALREVIDSRLRLRLGSSQDLMTSLPGSEHPQVVYLDPMFSHHGRSALASREMQIMQALLGSPEDDSGLLAAALACARKRVVVKRARAAPSIPGPKPSYSQKGKRTRFDVYLVTR